MKYNDLINLLDEIKTSFGDGAISTVNVIEDEVRKILSISIITSTNVVVFDKENSIIHKALNESINYMIKAKENKLVISFDIKYQ